MKNIKVLFLLLCFSFLTGGICTKAMSDYASFVGFVIPKSKGTVTISNKVKSDNAYELIEIHGTTLNRNLAVKVVDPNYTDNDNYITISVGDDYVYYMLGSQSSLSTATYRSYVYAGTKTMYIRTAVKWLNSTTASGTWWLSRDDFDTVQGWTQNVDYTIASSGKLTLLP